MLTVEGQQYIIITFDYWIGASFVVILILCFSEQNLFGSDHLVFKSYSFPENSS